MCPCTQNHTASMQSLVDYTLDTVLWVSHSFGRTLLGWPGEGTRRPNTNIIFISNNTRTKTSGYSTKD